MAGCLIPLLTLAVQTGLQVAANEQSKSAMNKRTAAELARQNEIQGKSRQAYAQSLQQSQPKAQQQQLQQGQQERQGMYEQVQGVADTPQAQVVAPDSVTLLRDAATRSMGNRSKAKLGAYDTWMLDQAVKNLRTNQMLSLYNNEAQRSQSLLPMELEAASHAGDTLSGIGQMVGTLGSLYGMIPSSTPTAAASTAGSAGLSFSDIPPVPVAGPNPDYWRSIAWMK